MTIKKMLVTAVVGILFRLSLPVYAQSPCKKQPIEILVKAVAEGYETKTMRSLDVQKPYVGKVRIVIEHSLAEDNAKDRFVIRSFASLARAERWLKSREHDEMPGRDTKPLVRCAKGVCIISTAGLCTILCILRKLLTALEAAVRTSRQFTCSMVIELVGANT